MYFVHSRFFTKESLKNRFNGGTPESTAKGGMTTAYIVNANSITMAFAVCSADDNFNKELGRDLSAERLRKASSAGVGDILVCLPLANNENQRLRYAEKYVRFFSAWLLNRHYRRGFPQFLAVVQIQLAETLSQEEGNDAVDFILSRVDKIKRPIRRCSVESVAEYLRLEKGREEDQYTLDKKQMLKTHLEKEEARRVTELGQQGVLN